jgi:predicted NAD/FAD-binding protein
VKIAVIGAGISGLGAAYALSGFHEVHVFEQAPRVGGHTNTVKLSGGVPVDTGFIVHNWQNYPNFVRLMEELGVPTCPSDMSFAYVGPELSWCSRGLNGLLAERGHLLSPRFWSFWREVRRFNAWGAAQLLAAAAPERTLQAALDDAGFSEDLRRAYLYPMAGAVWSAPVGEMGSFPVLTLLCFFQHHGMLGFATQRPWRTIPGGTGRYLEPLCRPFRERLHVNATVSDIRRSTESVSLHLEGTGRLTFDQLIFACPGRQVLPLLGDADPLELELLAAFKANLSPTWLHTDTALLPPKRRGWASWNYRQVPDGRLLLTYHMNRLQPLATRQEVLVTLHGAGQVDESRVLQKFDYEHPRFDLAAIRAQARWSELSGRRRTHHAGAHWGHGFHEDGLVSGLRAAAVVQSSPQSS